VRWGRLASLWCEESERGSEDKMKEGLTMIPLDLGFRPDYSGPAIVGRPRKAAHGGLGRSDE
jgi:hypothetical protein